MQLGNIHAENKCRQTGNWFLHTIGLAVLFLILSSFSSPSSISQLIPTSDDLEQDKLQSAIPECIDFQPISFVGLEVEEVEESKEEKKDVSTKSFIFCSPSCVVASKHHFLEKDILAGNSITPLPKAPLYLLFQTLRIPLS